MHATLTRNGYQKEAPYHLGPFNDYNNQIKHYLRSRENDNSKILLKDKLIAQITRKLQLKYKEETSKVTNIEVNFISKYQAIDWLRLHNIQEK